DANSSSTQIAVDGGVDSTNADKVVSAGADILVMGTAFFGAPDREGLAKQVAGLTR
ncbi:ribulose-phosphate 3-epimerase, partial [candidate division GN15 bacterium]|nr:ribulose-phosphate 3-epimerase [candidate division GN15 bacterium]